jgi:hypothetical protein
MAASNSAEVEKLALGAGMKKGGAAKGELVLAMYELANCFRNGWGIKKDPAAAKQYYETAANLGDTDAMNEVAWCYTEGFGTKKDKVCLLSHLFSFRVSITAISTYSMVLEDSTSNSPFAVASSKASCDENCKWSNVSINNTTTTTPSNDSLLPPSPLSYIPPASFFGQQHVPHCTVPFWAPAHAKESR